MQSLMNVKIGDICTIKWMMCDLHTAKIMQSCKVEEGSIIRVIHRYSGSVIIGVNDKRLAIGSEAAKKIKVSQFF